MPIAATGARLRGDRLVIELVVVALCAVGIVALWLDNRRLRGALRAAQDEAPAQVDPAAGAAFFSAVSHELHGPLNTVIGFSRLMLESATLDAGPRRSVECIQGAGERMLALVDDLIELARIEAGCLPLADEEVRVQSLVEDVVANLRAVAEGHGVTLAVDVIGPDWVRCDRGKLRRVLQALTVDAIGRTPAGGQVTVAAHARPASEGQVPMQFSIADSGPGLTSEALMALFAPFSSAGSQMPLQGAGLAMTLGQRYLRLMGGEIVIDRQAANGNALAFDLSLPLCEAPAAIAPQPAAPQVEPFATGRGRKILVADDAPEGRLLLCCVLEPSGVEVVEAENGAVAVTQWQRHRPDLILMDARMPELDGFEATRRIRRADPAVPIVLLSGTGGDDVREKAQAAGAVDFLTKPLDEQALYAVLERYLGIRAGGEASPGAETGSPPQPEAPAPTVSAKALAGLPPAALDALYAAVQEVNGTKVEAVLATIGPDQAGLVAALAVMTADFRFQEVWTLIEAARAEQDMARRAATPDVPAAR
ncbi:response regulator [Azoarcus sp. KH32C]|uniref:hybrid sensor histidine kinase/response regulator n=1 Tax=Azoarcus sp. KH32C TaxID=748247 RepID=UPI00023862F3|nr:response regulator [Azoarcus sp. KH32C]BAL26242.1 putative two-component system sensor protein [Azoarcus sp. KH32C]